MGLFTGCDQVATVTFKGHPWYSQIWCTNCFTFTFKLLLISLLIVSHPMVTYHNAEMQSKIKASWKCYLVLNAQNINGRKQIIIWVDSLCFMPHFSPSLCLGRLASPTTEIWGMHFSPQLFTVITLCCELFEMNPCVWLQTYFMLVEKSSQQITAGRLCYLFSNLLVLPRLSSPAADTRMGAWQSLLFIDFLDYTNIQGFP